MDTKTLCLGVLSAENLTGYEIKKVVEHRFRHFFATSYGAIYPALAELERRGLVTCEQVEQEGRPDKKVYRITPEGRDALVRELAQAAPRHRLRSEFLVLMYFAHLLPPAQVEAVLDAMIDGFERSMWADMEAYAEDEPEMTAGQRFALGYGRTVVSTVLAYLKRQKPQLLKELAEEQELAGEEGAAQDQGRSRPGTGSAPASYAAGGD